MEISIKPQRSVQLCAYGLIASGYDLYDRSDPRVVAAVKLIRHAFSTDTAIKAYFAWARSGQVAVNPYWPRGSGVVSTSLFIDVNNHLDLVKYFQHERAAASNAAWQEPDYQAWIARLPEMITLIERMDLTAADASLRRILQDRSAQFQADVEAGAALLAAFLDDTIGLDQLIYVPNVLLAPQLTDFVHDGNQLYVLATEPRIDSLIHELLHYALHECIVEIPEATLTSLLKSADLPKLQALGYSWDASQESNRRIIEESIVRCLTVLLESASDQIRDAKLQALRESGFIVPEHLARLTRETITLKRAREVISNAL